jgi:Domain of unknown function (DUF4470)
MLTPTVADTTCFFYPLGNTPAVCLTQDLPREEPASILLLGYGDVRNIFFTTYLDGSSGESISSVMAKRLVDRKQDLVVLISHAAIFREQFLVSPEAISSLS